MRRSIFVLTRIQICQKPFDIKVEISYRKFSLQGAEGREKRRLPGWHCLEAQDQGECQVSCN